MTTSHTTALVLRSRRPRGQHLEYLEAHMVGALFRAAPSPRARLLFLVEWRAGLRIYEARDLSLDTDRPTTRARQGKGSARL